jgi:AraC family transcriptional regulator, 4-hydroxyphenylacetate 3-monooxygenase operon regulatory protein
MKHIYTNTALGSVFILTDGFGIEKLQQEKSTALLKIVWNRNPVPVTIEVDCLPITLQPNQLMPLTPVQCFSYANFQPSLTAIMFNREFYCIQVHDYEVSCSGLLFYGTADIPIITLDDTEAVKFDLLYKVFIDELETKDHIQGEMLVMLLKRLIIKCTRLVRKGHIVNTLTNSQVDIIRGFNILVENHFKQLKQVADYAALLNKSPKTLANLFAAYNQQTPLQIIHSRILIESKRLLFFTQKTTKEIAFELGFDDPAHFGKFFKNLTGHPPTEFKEKHLVQV